MQMIPLMKGTTTNPKFLLISSMMQMIPLMKGTTTYVG